MEQSLQEMKKLAKETRDLTLEANTQGHVIAKGVDVLYKMTVGALDLVETSERVVKAYKDKEGGQ